MHQSGQANEALDFYSQSLTFGGQYSQNQIRLKALEAIELIIRENVENEKNKRKRGLQMRTLAILKGTRHTVPLERKDNFWSKCTSIYKYLSHHYILRRSVVFIVDTQFDSFVYRDKAMKYVNEVFRHRLDDEDYFGFISLDYSKQASEDEILIEKLAANKKCKQRLLREIAER